MLDTIPSETLSYSKIMKTRFWKTFIRYVQSQKIEKPNR